MSTTVLSAPSEGWVHLGKRKVPHVEQTRRKIGKLGVPDHGFSSSSSSSAEGESESEYEDAGFSISTPQTPLTRPSTPRKKTARPKSHVCPEEGCSKAFTRPVRLEEHLRSHRNERPFQCTYDSCQKSFLRQSHLNHHVKSAHSAVRDYVCDVPYCGKSFATGTRLRRHKELHQDKNKHRCTEYPPCHLTFRKQATLQRHIDSEHLGRKPFVCEELNPITQAPCGMSFENAKQLRAHKNMHLDNYTYLCSFCSLGVNQNGFSHQSSFVNFPSREKLLAHIAENHPHACDICSLVFSKRSSLQEHIEAKHSGKPVEERQKHTCSIQSCRKAFTRQSNLSSHYRTQHERKRFICGETDLSLVKGLTDWKNENSCGEQYKWKNGLINHVKKYHLGGEQIVRQSEKPTRKSKNTAISKLTGLDAGKGQIESLRCFDMFCYEQFPNQSSLEFHARQDHGMNDGDIAEALAEQEALQGGPFWIGGGDEQDSQFATADGGSLQPQDYEVPRLLSQSELFILEGYNAEGPSGVIDPALLHTG